MKSTHCSYCGRRINNRVACKRCREQNRKIDLRISCNKYYHKTLKWRRYAMNTLRLQDATSREAIRQRIKAGTEPSPPPSYVLAALALLDAWDKEIALLRARVDSGNRLLQLGQQEVDELRKLKPGAEIEANIVVLRAELASLRARVRTLTRMNSNG